ncbi:hypothetical protein DMN91_001117 [Ooceraea biroi]|uniref:non-specific serine/threonine protein kinase n=1 Tax=Ooceraea biroi TaxID=2015173 RepID=A0A026WDH7_OOCBI|nr:serine/threonine-protein kinase fused [Ooceraea biroi]EZA54125.1 Serine/threonine-protein kinase [Ooceraea biroi]RLU27316.1 hypothetical protein DMN91_001117 [Ooceraea biroi]
MKRYESFKMKKYEILKQIGEGSFGQVYKAKKRSDGEIVAFKMIRKCGRSFKELKSLRQECEIQRHLHHPNIVLMIDSFETENEIVVVTEYADKELYDILDKEGRLSEERAQVVTCDLVSALYYLHSNRVMHRDLKPQNVLLESNGVAKLCDFGFARSMSTGTHVLTSIKGTPLYMAPELIEECPYDHNADLWSLGCIVYELVVGSPPFQTNSILHLVKLIRFEAIKWPDFISSNCKNFLQGLLQKDPSQRLTWPALLEHPFVKDRIIIVGGTVPTPFTTPLSASQARAKQQQLQSLAMRSTNQTKVVEKAIQKMQEQERKHREHRHRTCFSQPGYQLPPAYYQQAISHCQTLRHSEPSGTDSSASIDVLLGNLSLRASLRSDLLAADHAICQTDCPHGVNAQHNFPVPSENYSTDYTVQTQDDNHSVRQLNRKLHRVNIQGDGVNVGLTEKSSHVDQMHDDDDDCKQSGLNSDLNRWEFSETKVLAEKRMRLPDWDLKAVERPIENEEWVAFLQKSMEEIMEGEVDSMLQQNCVSVFVSPLRNPAAGCRVIEYVACLLLLPFTVSISKNNLKKIETVYLDVRVVPNLVYAIKLLMSKRPDNESYAADRGDNAGTRPASSLSADELQALECAMLVLCRLVYVENQFLMQFCDAIYIVNGMSFLKELLALEKRKVRVVMDLVAILNNVLRSQPENAELVERVVLRMPGSSVEQLNRLLNHRQAVLRARTCIMIRLLARFCCRALQQVWNRSLRNVIEGLTEDEDELVRQAAEDAVAELKQLTYYNQKTPTN